VVYPHLVPSLIEIAVISMPYSLDHTPILEGDVFPIPIIMHHLQPRIEEVLVPVQYLVNHICLVEGDASFKHIVCIPDPTPFEQERLLLSLISLPPSIEEIPFDWDGLVGYPITHPMSFPVRDIIRYITETISFTITLSSSTWRDLGFPKLMSAIRKILTFHRSPAREPWPPPWLAA